MLLNPMAPVREMVQTLIIFNYILQLKIKLYIDFYENLKTCFYI